MKRRICVVLLILMATALCACTKTEPGGTDIMNTDITEAIKPVPVLVIDVNGKLFYASLEDNSSAQALVEKLNPGPITVDMHDYGNFEKVGPLPWELPRNDERITTVPGDIILYQGDHDNEGRIEHCLAGNIPRGFFYARNSSSRVSMRGAQRIAALFLCSWLNVMMLNLD